MIMIKIKKQKVQKSVSWNKKINLNFIKIV